MILKIKFIATTEAVLYWQRFYNTVVNAFGYHNNTFLLFLLFTVVKVSCEVSSYWHGQMLASGVRRSSSSYWVGVNYTSVRILTASAEGRNVLTFVGLFVMSVNMILKCRGPTFMTLGKWPRYESITLSDQSASWIQASGPAFRIINIFLNLNCWVSPYQYVSESPHQKT